MTQKITSAIWLACVAAAFAGETTNPSVPATGTKLPDIGTARALLTYSDGMDLDNIPGNISVTEFNFISALSRPITMAGDIMLLPFVQYSLTGLDVDGVPPAFPIADEDLHSLSVHLAAVKWDSDSPWFYGAWSRAELASDFQHISDDDFTLDIAAGVGYRFSDSFTLAAGAAVMNINGDTWICPGINFDWVVTDTIRVGLYGPMSLVSYTPNDDWIFSLRGIPGGSAWNITDGNGDSKSIDLSSYQVGAFASRRLTDALWFTAGGGLTLFNNIKYSDQDGDNELLDEDMEGGWFGQVGLRLNVW